MGGLNGGSRAARITALFWDVGDVVLSGGWNTAHRAEATRVFDLDHEQFEARHQEAAGDFGAGRLDLEFRGRESLVQELTRLGVRVPQAVR